VALNSDASVSKLKGPERPVQSEAVRAAVMAAVKGADYAEDQIVGADIVRARGGRIVRVNLVDGQSTTKIIEKSKRG